MSPQFYLALIALSSLTAASDPGCEELIKPLEDKSQVSGKWIFHAGTTDNKDLLLALKTINSSWVEFSLVPDSDNIILHWADKMAGKCEYGGSNSTDMGNYTEMTVHFNSTEYKVVGRHLETCSDCILWTDTTVTVENGKTKEGRGLYIFTKSGELDSSDLDVFKKQAACLNFSPDFHFGDNTDLCPDEKETAKDSKEDDQ